jgi:hypothetical protein
MHVHSNPINPNAQLDALSSAQRAEGKREAARVRKKLSECASESAGEAESGDGCVVRLGAREDSQDTPKQQGQRSSRKKQKDRADTDAADVSISDWA